MTRLGSVVDVALAVVVLNDLTGLTEPHSSTLEAQLRLRR